MKEHYTNSQAAQTGGTGVALANPAGCPLHPGTVMLKPRSCWQCLSSPAGGGEEDMFAPC